MRLLCTFLLIASTYTTQAQRISYSNTSPANYQFDLIGKIGSNYLVSKQAAFRHTIAVYDSEMRLLSDARLRFMKYGDLKIGIINCQDNFIFIYQVRDKKNRVICKAVKLDASGEQLADPVALDTTKLSDPDERNMYKYTANYSKDKQTILIQKSMAEGENLITTNILLTQTFKRIDEYREERVAYEPGVIWSRTLVDNNGTTVVTKTTAQGTGRLTEKVELHVRKLYEQSAQVTSIPLGERLVTQVRTDIDNVSQRYIVNALFLERNQSSVEGLLTAFVDAGNTKSARAEVNFFSDLLKASMFPGADRRNIFNNLKLRNIFIKKSGGFMIAMEDHFIQHYKLLNTASVRRVGDPFALPEEAYHPRIRDYDFLKQNQTEAATLRSDSLLGTYEVFRSIVLVEIDSSLGLTWNTVINKNQEWDIRFSSYGNYQTDSETLFLFGSYNAPEMINHYGILPNGEFKKYNILKTLVSGHRLMPRFSLQVGPKQVIVPASYKEKITFALVDFSKEY